MARFTTNDAVIAYEDSGAGSPALLFVHGLCCAGGDWALQRKAFEATHRVVSVDQRGHGDSTYFGDAPTVAASAGDVIALIEHLNLAPVVLAGHSLGCRVVMEVAAQRPDLVAGVVFVDGSRLSEPGEIDAATRAEALIEDHGGVSLLIGTMFDAMFNERSSPERRETITERALRVPMPVAHSMFVSGFVYDDVSMPSALQRLACPLLVIQSTTFTPQTGRRSLGEGESSGWLNYVGETARDVTIDLIPDVAHFTMIDAPEETNRSIGRFLARLKRGG